MPVVARGDMNGYRDFEHGHLRTSSYANGYDPYRRDREDFSDYPSPSPRRAAMSYVGDMPTNRSDVLPTSRSEVISPRSYRDGYRANGNGRRYNGGVDDIEQNSFDTGGRDGNEPSFEVDHLATYTSKSGTTHPNDGLTKLKQMENSTGIWTMRCLLVIERSQILIIDKANGDELERFPLSQVHEPTAVLKNDRRETYNNLVMFTIVEDSRRKNSPSDMHIFQSVNSPAHDIVDDILSAKGEGGGRRGPYNDRAIPPPPREPAPEPPYGKFSNYRETHAPAREEPIENRLRETRLGETETGRFNDGRYGVSRVGDFRASYVHKEDMDAGQNEALERNVQLLNNCFDDIEKFVSRLQGAAEAYKELERRRVERGNKRKQRSGGDGMLGMRARPPPAEDFVDIFQKFKFAFNLLAKLKAHIHDPNAPELVHFLFTPLSLIYEASRDPIHGGRELSSEAVSPLLLQESKSLFVNCLTSKEQELWLRLGKAWTQTKDDWPGYVQPYNPRFYNGWQPLPQAIEDVNQERIRDTQGPYSSDYRREDPYSRDIRATGREDPYSRDLRTTAREDPYKETRREDPYYSRREEPIYQRDIRSVERRPPSPPIQERQEYVDRSDRNKRSGRDPIAPATRTKGEENMNFAQELKRMGATIYEAVNDRQGKNQKELTVEKGDILQVLDKSRNWWKLKNYQGETGYAPYTILKEYQPSDEYDNGHGGRLSGEYSSYINGNAPPPPPPPMSGVGRSSQRQGGENSGPPRQAVKPNPPTEPPKPRNPPPTAGPPPMNRMNPFQHELKSRVNTSDDSLPSPRNVVEPRGPEPRRQPVSLSQYSTADEVREWMINKGFSGRSVDLLQGYAGLDLFNFDRQELETLLGKEEGRHLDSQLKVQKSNSGFRTRGTSELKAILQRRKVRADDTGYMDDRGLGSRPNFMPDTPPDYSPDGSEASSDDFGDAGKTLRYLLERQRKKISRGNFE